MKNMSYLKATFNSILLTVVGAQLFPLSAFAQSPVYTTPPLDMATVVLEDEGRAKRGELAFYGRMLPMDISTALHGVWSTEDHDRVWRAQVSSEGAHAIELFYDDVLMPDGAELFILDAAGMVVHGPFGAEQIFGRVFSTPLVLGDHCSIEYRVPLSAAAPGGFRVTHVGHAYRDVLDGSCNVDVVCSPEGDDWIDAASGVVRISIVAAGGVGWCTGSLVNNLRRDCKPYILSAWHCGAGSTAAQMNSYKFYFGYQRPNCGSGTAPSTMFLTGAQLKAYSNDNSGNAGSDFMLLEMNTAVPPSFPHYWLGWDATSQASSTADGVCIHHPTGFPKRISSYTQTLTTGHWASSTGLQSHWRVKWVATPNGHGVTESGSSGAPLFRPTASGEPRVIGTLSGSTGQLSCANLGGTSFFGKFSYHWTQNPNTAQQKLRPWLDPDNTGELQMEGSASPCTAVAGLQEKPDRTLSVVVEADGRTVFVTFPQGVSGFATGWIVDPAGRIAAVVAPRSSTAVGFRSDIPYLSPGVYSIVLSTNDAHYVGRFSLTH